MTEIFALWLGLVAYMWAMQTALIVGLAPIGLGAWLMFRYVNRAIR